MKLGSLFDGIGGWLLAAKHAGVTPVWASEIDDFPAAVTRYYWGVPQRRKRIFLVADFGGHSAGEILFERKGLSGDSTESQGTGEETAGNAGKGVDRAGETLTPWDVQSNRIQGINGKAAALYGGEGQGTHNGAVFDTRQIDSASGIAYSFDSLASNSMKSKNPHSGCRQVEVSKTLDTTTPDPSKNQGGIAILKAPTQFADEGKIVVGSLCAHDGRGFNGYDVEQNKVVYPAGKVRRLTPTECERLQGLPDGYTDIEFKGKPAPDSRRYKALGNGMAQPCADYVIRRIQEVNDSGQTERLGTCR